MTNTPGRSLRDKETAKNAGGGGLMIVLAFRLRPINKAHLWSYD